MNKVKVHKGRVNTIIINMGFVVTGETYSSQIRTNPSNDAILIASWTVTIQGTTQLKCVLDDTGRGIDVAAGYMDLKRVSAGVALPVFDEPIEVEFQETVTT